MINRLAIAFVLLFFNIAATAQTANDSGANAPLLLAGEKLVVFIKSDEIRQVGMGLHLARGAAKQGGTVTVIFGADGVKYPLRNGVQDIFGATSETPREIITDIIAAGGKAYVCKLCTTWLDYEEADFIENVSIVDGRKIFQVLFADGAQSLEF